MISPKRHAANLEVVVDALKADNERLRADNERLREALEIYADDRNWRHSCLSAPVDLWISCDLDKWNGPDVARAALKGLTK